MKKPHKIFFAPKKQCKILPACGLSIRQLAALGCWSVTLLLLLLQKICEYYRTCCDYLVATACQDVSAWNERKKVQYFYQLVVKLVRDLWKSNARTFSCLVLLRWERTSGKGAMQAIVGSNLYCSLLNFKSPLICIVGKQRKDHKLRSLNYYFFANQRVLFFTMPFLPHKGFVLKGRLKTAKCECLWSIFCKATAVTHTNRIDRNLLRKETSFVCYTSSVLRKSRHMK